LQEHDVGSWHKMARRFRNSASQNADKLADFPIRPTQDCARSETGITVERPGICVRKGDTALRDAINAAQAALAADGTLAALVKQWLGAGATLPS
jgi:ABC-type amino acid transport substrate-binding protein